MQKILYLTTTDWGWAKQRPQFIAEGLSKFYNVLYVNQKSYRRNNFIKNSISNSEKINFLQIFRFPYDNIFFISLINKLIFNLVILFKIRKYNIIWITHPLMYSLAKLVIPKSKIVIYDCMDDHIEFPTIKKNKKIKDKLLILEKQLTKRANIIFATSEYLKNKINNRYLNVKPIYIVNNAISKNILDIEKSEYIVKNIEHLKEIKLKKIVYTGTISEWLDFELIIKSLEKFDNIIYIFFGPSQVAIPNHSRIIDFGPINHNQIIHAMNIADILVMPFKKSELIYSVNPVKVYEYLVANKPILILKYDETIKFQDYAYLYNNESEYLTHIENLSTCKLKPKQEKVNCLRYVNQNTWDDRIEEIVSYINPFLLQFGYHSI